MQLFSGELATVVEDLKDEWCRLVDAGDLSEIREFLLSFDPSFRKFVESGPAKGTHSDWNVRIWYVNHPAFSEEDRKALGRTLKNEAGIIGDDIPLTAFERLESAAMELRKKYGILKWARFEVTDHRVLYPEDRERDHFLPADESPKIQISINPQAPISLLQNQLKQHLDIDSSPGPKKGIQVQPTDFEIYVLSVLGHDEHEIAIRVFKARKSEELETRKKTVKNRIEKINALLDPNEISPRRRPFRK